MTFTNRTNNHVITEKQSRTFKLDSLSFDLKHVQMKLNDTR